MSKRLADWPRRSTLSDRNTRRWELLGLWVLFRNRIPQQRGHFFLHLEDDLRLTQIFRQTGILSAQLLIFFFQWMTFRLRPASLALLDGGRIR